jgi:formylmethanofuran dehydrogenase subunit C
VSALVLTLRAPPAQRIDLSALTPERLGAGAADLARLELVSGNRRLALGEVFDVTPGEASDVVIRGGTSRLDFIGRGLREGTLTVEGDAGAYLGQGMQGGRLRVVGSVGPWAAAAMGGGVIEIEGDAGDFLGAALPGEMRGMSGGLVAVTGSAGGRAGDRMRRGTILVGGAVGEHAGSRMIAGTLVGLGSEAAVRPGYLMKRGTLLLRGMPQRLLPSFADCGAHDLGFLRLLSCSLDGFGGWRRRLDELGIRVRRLAGDAAVGGTGELLVWQG